MNPHPDQDPSPAVPASLVMPVQCKEQYVTLVTML
jgi:hypothetical protein